MRPLKLSLVVTALLAATLVSCKKDGTVAPAPANYISLNYDAMSFRTTNMQNNYSSGFLSMLGVFNSHSMVSLVIHKPIIGSFDISNGAAAATFSDGSSDQYMSNTGAVNITSISGDTMRGTFRLHCVEISSGHTCELIDGAFQEVSSGN